MKKSKTTARGVSAANPARNFRVGVFLVLLFLIGAATAIARYESHLSDLKAPSRQNKLAGQPGSRFVTVDVGGKKLQVNAQALQQGPLTTDQAQQIADALKDNTSSDGLVQVQNPDGSTSVDLQGRFQNVILAKKNSDGRLDQTCVDNAESASAFLQSKETTTQTGRGQGRKAVVKE